MSKGKRRSDIPDSASNWEFVRSARRAGAGSFRNTGSLGRKLSKVPVFDAAEVRLTVFKDPAGFVAAGLLVPPLCEPGLLFALGRLFEMLSTKSVSGSVRQCYSYCFHCEAWHTCRLVCL